MARPLSSRLLLTSLQFLEINVKRRNPRKKGKGEEVELYLSTNISLFGGLVLLDIEVLDLVGLLVLGDDVEELPKAVLFQVFLGKVLEVPLGEGHGADDIDFRSVIGNFDLVSKFASLAINFDPLTQILGEVGRDEDLVLDGLGAVDGEG